MRVRNASMRSTGESRRAATSAASSCTGRKASSVCGMSLSASALWAQPSPRAEHGLGEPGGDGGEDGDEEDADAQNEEERQHRPGDTQDVVARQALDHEQVEAHGRRDLGDLDDKDDEDAEPD